VEVYSHLERDLAVRTVCRVELAKVVEMAGGDKEVVFDVTCSDNLVACLEDCWRDSLLVLLVYATW